MTDNDRCEICGENLRWREDDGYCGDDFYSAENFEETMEELVSSAAMGESSPEFTAWLEQTERILSAIHDRLREDIDYYEHIMKHEGIE